MIHVNNKDISGVYSKLKEIVAVYSGLKLVWLKSNIIDPDNPIENILSCYYNGYWIDEYPWTDDTSWID